MSIPLYQAKAAFFRVLGHPVRIRVVELLRDGPRSVRELLAEIKVEASSLSQQLAVLRRAGLVTARREGGTVVYSLPATGVADVLATARHILTEVLARRGELLDELRAETTR